jgi:hypothetical protein
VSGAPVAPAPQTYQLTINFAGTYAGLQKLFGEFQVSARPMRVTGVQLAGTGGSLSGEIDIQTYYQAAAQWPFGTETIK